MTPGALHGSVTWERYNGALPGSVTWERDGRSVTHQSFRPFTVKGDLKVAIMSAPDSYINSDRSEFV